MALYVFPSLSISLILIVGVTINDSPVFASTVTPEMYWKSVLPNTPMPTAIKSSLVGKHGNKTPFRATPNTCIGVYQQAATQKQVDDYVKAYGETYMLESGITPGRIIQVRLKTHTDNKANFLPQGAENSIPFSSDKLAQILERFSTTPSSNEAAVIKETVRNCEESHEGEAKLCATSLESMVAFVRSHLGDRVSPSSSTSVDKDGKIIYKMVGVEKIVGYESPAVVCHKELYPYAVFSCHQVEKTAAYMVSLVAVGGQGLNVKAAAVCHKDTSWWSPKHVSFQVLNAKPGKTTPICHFLDDLAVIWTKNNN